MENNSLQLHSGSPKEKRRELDFYPTPREVTVALLDFLQLNPCKVWEPACGNGAMSKVIREYGHEVIETDIINGFDYLQTSIKSDAIITNPPFNLSAEFIQKAINEADLVAMVLKSQYWHAKKRLDLFFQNPPAYILLLTWRPDFMNGESGGSPTMEVIWTVWIKGNTDAKYIPLKKPELESSQYTLFN
jgi:type I restriction-modification system DNA methylase subunit